MADIDSITRIFTRERDTKRMVRFHEDPAKGPQLTATGDRPGTLYVSKEVLAAMGNPNQIEVTVAPTPAGMHANRS